MNMKGRHQAKGLGGREREGEVEGEKKKEQDQRPETGVGQKGFGG